MKVLYFGAYNPLYARNSILIQGLRQNGVEVLECRDSSPGLRKFIKLFINHWKLRNTYDVLVVGFLGQVIMPLASLLNLPIISLRTRKPLVFDAFMSLYDSNVFGREKIKPKSPKALYYWLLDWLSMHLGDLVLFDTQQHIQYASQEFGVAKRRLAKLFIGAQENIFYPQTIEKQDSMFRVLFHGSFIKSQGIEYILQAAKELEHYNDILFTFVGDGQVKKEMTRLADVLKLRNIRFTGSVSLSEVAHNISEADVCLGIFGKAEKIQRVIPNKVFECVAMRKAVITADTPAVRELFDESDLQFTGIADTEGIVRGILTLRNNRSLLKQLGENAYKKYRLHASTAILGKEYKAMLLKLV